MKEAIFHLAVLDSLRSFPAEIRKEIGKLILDLQCGAQLSMPVSRSIPSVAKGAQELRVKDRSGNYRVFYFTRSSEGILIFHAFMKKTQKTPKKEIEL